MRWCGWGVLSTVVACVAFSVQAAPPSPRSEGIQAATEAGSPAAGQASQNTVLVAPDREPLQLPGLVAVTDDEIRLHEVSGRATTVRVTPVDEQGTPVDGGRVIVLRANEKRSIHLAATLPIEDLIGRRLVIETIGGAGQAEVEATWLTPGETAVAAATPYVPRRHLTRVTLPTSGALIDQAEASGTLNHETAVLYHVYALFADARLPAAYRGDDSQEFESLYLSTVVGEWPTYSAGTQAALQPFLTPPAYVGSWANASAVGHTMAEAHTLGATPICGSTSFALDWQYKENDAGYVRIWYNANTDDAAVAAFLATAADTKIWPTFASFMAPHLPLPDSGEPCSGGNSRLDVYLTDVARAYTTPYSGCSNSAAFIVMSRADGANTLAHEMFHAFQYSFPVGGCLTADSYRWWTEGSATWAEQYIYPFDSLALSQGIRLINTPEQALDSVRTDIDRVYGTFLVPFWVQNKYGSPDFVRVGWENCYRQDAIHAVDAAIPGGFAQVWHEVALRDWNNKPVDEYSQWRPPITYHAKPQANLLLTSGPEYETSLQMNLAHLSATYERFHFQGPEISSVAFFNGATFNLQKMDVPSYGPFWNPQAGQADKIKGVKVQAIIKIEGQDPKVEDWTGKPYVTFCRDTIAERLEELTIVISNAQLDDSGGNATPPGLPPVLWASNMGCWRWTGTTHYQATTQDSSQTDDVAKVVWDRVSANHGPPQILYQATGNVQVTMGGKCSGGGTAAITPSASTLVTYNSTPSNAQGRRGYVGSALETGTLPITCQGKGGITLVGPWFNVPLPQTPNPPSFTVSPDGKRLTGNFTQKGITWTWDLRAQRE